MKIPESLLKFLIQFHNQLKIVLISDPEGIDMFVELGIAISNALESGKPKIYAVGDYNKRSLMHFHPKINHVNNLEEIFLEEGLNINDIKPPSFDNFLNPAYL